ncbi:hypothetical protein EB001_10035 [bacterium]|nr:hypothetical protein [bacterium]
MTEEKKVKKSAAVKRPKFADEKHLGSEPTVNENSTQTEMALAYNWFNYFYTSDDAKAFTISYLKSIKYDKHIITKLAAVKSIELHNIGWNCRLLQNGNTLPDGEWDRIEERLILLSSKVLDVSESEEEQPTQKVVSIQDRINAKASDLIGELEEETDVFFQEGVIQFDIKKWSLEKGIKPQIAKRIAEHFRPQYEEICEAQEGKDPDLVEAYKGWRKPVLKIMGLFLKKIIDHMTEVDAAGPHILVSKLKYKVEDKDLNITSVQPKDIIHASQLWVYNCKYRNLSVYNALGNSGLSVRGTTITGYDADSSITKKLRKPEQRI